MDQLKLNWGKYHAWQGGGDFARCHEARAGLFALHAFTDGRWAVGMYRGWRAREEGRAAPDLVEAMRAAEAFLLAQLTSPLEESPRVAAWRQARESGIAAGNVSGLQPGEYRARMVAADFLSACDVAITFSVEGQQVKCTGFVDADESYAQGEVPGLSGEMVRIK